MSRKQYPTKKPYVGYPLSPRQDGRFGKKIHGKYHAFGRDGNWREALDEYLAVARPLHAGDKPATKPVRAPTVLKLVNRFLDVRRKEIDAGIIKLGTWDDYRETLHHFADMVGRTLPASELRGDHLDRFARYILDKLKLGTSRYHLYRANLRAFFRYVFDAGWLPVFPLGVHFKRIPRAKVRRERKNRMIEPAHLRIILEAATGQLGAMILLALNGGMGNTDCATLAWADVDLSNRLIDYHRGKTGIVRTIPLWPQTVEALKAIRIDRPADELVFRTSQGNLWVRETEKGQKIISKDSIAQAFSNLLESFCLVGVKNKTFRKCHPGIGFYWLRHTHRTLSDDARDPHASMRIMGHAFPGMSDVYVEAISVERLRAVVDHVRARIFQM